MAVNERVSRWVGVGVLTAGLSAAMLVSAAVAAADSESGADADVSSSQSEPADDAAASNPGPADPADEETDEPAVDEDEAAAEDDVDEEVDEQEPAEADTDAGDGQTDPPADTGDESAADSAADRVTVEPSDPPAEPDVVTEQETAGPEDSDVSDVIEEPTVERAAADVPLVAAEPETPAPSETEPSTARFVMSAVEADEPAPARPNLINIIGSLFFGVVDFFTALFEGPPAVPPGSTVRVGRSTLEIDCGDGYQASTNWYFPTEAEPDKVIYFQHGAFARASLYNYTAAELAERNNAIVVAPSITSNYFACDGCQMAGEQMHAGIAELFLDEDRAALLASAQAAGYTGIALPERFVIAGHSGGGQTAGGAAGYYAEFAQAVAPERLHDMAGVLLLDSSPIGGAIERGVAKIPLDIPVYAISAEPGPLNDYGGLNEVLAEVRPGFVGVQLIDGVHGDSWQSGNPLIQFFVELGTGFPKPQNIEAVHVLSQGWISDWFEGTHTDELYGERGEVITIATAAGQAQAYVIPAPRPQLTIIDQIIRALLRSTTLLSQFSGNCAADPSPPDVGSVQNSTPNTVLSLDGKASRGQSVGQHVCTG